MSEPKQKQTDEKAAEQAAVLARLWAEFDRINAAHFDGALVLREIKLSTRKQYGGYYRHFDSLIVLSWPAYVEHGWDETLHTFRHEIAHIVHQNHKPAFWQLAFALGCTRKFALPPQTRPHAHCKFVYECPACQRRVFRRKRLIKSSCGVCDKAFNPRFALRLVSSPGLRAKL